MTSTTCQIHFTFAPIILLSDPKEPAGENLEATSLGN